MTRQIPPSLPQELIKGQSGTPQGIPRVELTRGPLQPYTIRNTLSLAGVPALPFRVELDARTRHLVLINEGADPLVVGPAVDLLWTWSQPGVGPAGVVHPGDSFPFRDLFLQFPVIWLDIPVAAPGSCIATLHGW